MLQVMFVAVDIGLISQVPHRSEANFGESCQGQDVILISCYRYPLCGTPLKLCLLPLFVNSVCELKTCNILLPLKCSVLTVRFRPSTYGLPVSDLV